MEELTVDNINDKNINGSNKGHLNNTTAANTAKSRIPLNKRYANTASNKMRSNSTALNGFSGTSPFRRLNDEEVFITRETEKQKRKEAKERAKNLKIWDKKTSTSRMPLKRVKDSDIPPAEMDENNNTANGGGGNIYNFNSEQRGYISSAMHIAKSRVSFSRGDHSSQQIRPQNIKEFVDQKKEMFLVELSFNTVKKEIEELDHKQSRKKTAIETSQAQLEKDSMKLMKFIEKDQIKTSKKEKKAKKAMRDCQSLQDENKDLDNKINNIRSEISKNKDTLAGLEEHKKFLLDLSKIQNAAWVVEQEMQKQKKRELVKRRWIEEHKRDTKDDHIIFREDDDLFSFDAYIKGGAASSVAGTSTAAEGAPAQGGAGGLLKQRKAATANMNAIQFQQLKRENMTEKDWEMKFEMLFAEDLIPLDEDFFDEELCFKDPNDLNKIFSELEEQNLYLIHQSQELEHSKEIMKQEELRLKEKLGKDVATHKNNRNLLLEKIQESKSSLHDLKKKSSVITIQTTNTPHNEKGSGQQQVAVEQEVNIEEILNDLRRDICRVYREGKNSEMDLQAKQTIDILTEIEVELEEKMKQIGYIESIDENEVNKEERLRKAEYKKQQREIKMVQEKQLIDQKNSELKSRMERVYEKVGRQAMPRSQKKQVKREVRVVKIDQETLDRQRYLGEEIPSQFQNGTSGNSGLH